MGIAISLGLSQASFANGSEAAAMEKNLYVVHIIPGDATNYTATKEISDIEKSTHLAIKDFRERVPTCSFRQDFTIKTGTEKQLFEKVSEIAKSPGKNIAVGFSRSSLARLAAKAAQHSDLIGISIGASTDDLRSINDHFVTVASPWSEQWKELHAQMMSSGCTTDSTTVVSDAKDSYSFKFQKAAAEAGYKNLYRFDSEKLTSTFDSIAKKSKCFFLAMNMSTSQSLVTKLLKTKWQGRIFGTGDWYFYSGELKQLIQSSTLPSGIEIYVPTGWNSEENKSARDLNIRLTHILGHKPEPNSVYSYDAITLALGYLCMNQSPLEFSYKNLAKLRLIRSYRGLSEGGNYLSPIHLETFRAK